MGRVSVVHGRNTAIAKGSTEGSGGCHQFLGAGGRINLFREKVAGDGEGGGHQGLIDAPGLDVSRVMGTLRQLVLCPNALRAHIVDGEMRLPAVAFSQCEGRQLETKTWSGVLLLDRLEPGLPVCSHLPLAREPEDHHGGHRR